MADLITTPGAADADAYVSLDAFKAWADANGKAYPANDELTKAAIRAATRYIDGAYGRSFSGYPINGRSQALAFPMSGLTDAKGYGVPSDAIPREVVLATCEAAAREVVKPGTLMPDQKAGGAILQRIKTGDTELEYALGGSNGPRFPAVEAALAPLRASIGDVYSVAAVRA